MAFQNKLSGAAHADSRWPGLAASIRNLSPIAQFLALGIVGFPCVMAVGSVLVGDILPAGVLVGAGFYGLALAVAVLALRASYPHPGIGLCNTVTLFRLMLVSVLLAALITSGGHPWAVFALASLALLLDGVDGWLARREGYVSVFGARFDMEVDSALALLLALLAYQSGSVGAYVILLGLPRYVFLAAQGALPWLGGDLPPRFSRKVVCVLQIGALLLVLMPVIDRPVSDLMVWGASAAVAWSFWRDLRWLWRARRS